MSKQISYILMILMTLCIISCEKGDFEDELCTIPSGEVDGWEEPRDSTVTQKQDSTEFVIVIDEWGNLITHEVSV